MVLSQNWKKELLASSLLPVRPSAWTNLAATGHIFVKFCMGCFAKNSYVLLYSWTCDLSLSLCRICRKYPHITENLAKLGIINFTNRDQITSEPKRYTVTYLQRVYCICTHPSWWYGHTETMWYVFMYHINHSMIDLP